MTDLFTKQEARFLRRAIKNKLADLHSARQKIVAVDEDDLVALMAIEGEIDVLESAWSKLKAVL